MIDPATPAALPDYEVVGLKKAPSMPIEFGGQRYDLAALTPEQAAHLLQFPEQVPFLRAVAAAPAGADEPASETRINP